MRRFGKILASRISVFALVVIIELLLLMTLFLRLSSLSAYFLVLSSIINLISIIAVVNKDSNPEYKLTWICVIVLIPFLGTLLYLLYGKGYVTRSEERVIKEVREGLRLTMRSASQECSASSLSPAVRGKTVAINSIDNLARVYTSTESRYYSSGNDAYRAMLADIGCAERYIFLEYFIIEDGEMWRGIYDVLLKKARAGVEVRIIYDDVGCMTTLPLHFDKQLAREGISAMRFSKITPSLRYMRRNNSRDHRKLLVVDGRTAYTGGMNIADEYIGLNMRLGVWRDSCVRVVGDAAEGFAAMFLELWCTASRTVLDFTPYFNTGSRILGDGGYYLPFGSGPLPLYKKSASKRALLDIISTSERYLYISTPYLIVDFDLTEALVGAALRGVDVRVITPGVPDKPLVKLLTRGSYPALLDGGVKIYEYDPGFLHAKALVADDLYAMVGTVNLDYRSLVHHYEDALWMYSSRTAFDIREDLLSIISESRHKDKESVRAGTLSRIIRSTLRLFAPLF